MSEAPGLLRALRRRDLAGMMLNAVIGAGMLAAPSKVFDLAGTWSFALLGLAALLILPLILVFADLGSRFTGTGGPYLYARASLPGWVAFAVGWMLWISQALAIATLCNLLISYLSGFYPIVAQGPARAAVIVALGVGLTSIVLRGIRQSAAGNNALILIKAVFVAGFVAAGIGFVSVERLTVATPLPAGPTVLQAILIYLFAYTGFERAGVLAGETRDPRRDVPAAMFASIGAATAAYAAVLLVCVGVLDDPSLTDRPLAEVGRLLFGPAGQVAVSAGAVAVILGTILSVIIGMPRLLLALAEQGQLPAVLGRVHPRTQTPYVAILVSSGIAFAAALASDLLGALTISTAARMIAYILCCVALWRLAGDPGAPAAQFNLPARRPVSLITAAIFTGVLVFAATKELPMLAAVLVAGFVLLALSRRALSPGPRNTP
ncbi:MAG: APC family permease [Pseudomonadota bacterium]